MLSGRPFAAPVALLSADKRGKHLANEQLNIINCHFKKRWPETVRMEPIIPLITSLFLLISHLATAFSVYSLIVVRGMDESPKSRSAIRTAYR